MALSKVPYTDYQTVVTAANMNAIQDEIISTTSLALCNTAPGTASKSATLLNFVLSTGAAVKVKFADTNTAANPTLNINSTGAQAIMQYGRTPVGTTPNTSWNAGDVVEFVYDGTNWVIVGKNLQEASSTQAGLLSAADKGVIDTVGDVSDLDTTAQSTVVAAINEVLDDVKQGFANNLIPYPYYNVSGTTHNGITYTVNSDGSVTAVGTATSTSQFVLSNTLSLPDGDYILTGDMDTGTGSEHRTSILFNENSSSGTSHWNEGIDVPCLFTVNGYTLANLRIRVNSGETVNQTFYPMLTKGTIAHDYVPYADSIGGIKEISDTISDAYSSSKTYKVGQLCIYNNTLYRCTTAITTAEAWNASHWTATTIAAEIENRMLWFSSVTVSAASGTIVTLNDSRITTNHVLARCEFANNAAITALTAWNTNTAGRLTISGTCTAATTAEIVLVKKDN